MIEVDILKLFCQKNSRRIAKVIIICPVGSNWLVHTCLSKQHLHSALSCSFSYVNIGINYANVWPSDAMWCWDFTEFKAPLLAMCFATSGAVFSVGERSSGGCGLVNFRDLWHAREPMKTHWRTGNFGCSFLIRLQNDKNLLIAHQGWKNGKNL